MLAGLEGWGIPSLVEKRAQPAQGIVHYFLGCALDFSGLARAQVHHAALVHQRNPLGFASGIHQGRGKAGVACVAAALSRSSERTPLCTET